MTTPREVFSRYAPLASAGWIALSALTFYLILSEDKFAAALVFLCLTFWVPACFLGIWIEMRRVWMGDDEARADVQKPIGVISSLLLIFAVVSLFAIFVAPAVISGLKKPAIPQHIQEKYGLD